MTKAGPLELALESFAALWTAGCVGFAISKAASPLGMSQPLPMIMAGAALSALAVHRLLWRMRNKQVPLAGFEPVEIGPLEPRSIYERLGELLLTPDLTAMRTELLLTNGQRLDPPVRSPADAEELLLDDVLAELKPDSRVVRLFNPADVPTAGELKARIDRHLGEGMNPAAPRQQDDSQALYDALANLRRSLG
jgi:hypothetical protein